MEMSPVQESDCPKRLGSGTCVAFPLESRALPNCLVLVPAVPSSLTHTHAPGPIGITSPRVSEGSSGGQWDSSRAEGSSLAAGATSTAHR